MKVLLVEDDDRFADALTTALSGRGHRVERVSRADEGLRRKSSVDFVLLDLGLPDGDGLDMLRRLRQVSAVPVIVLTARTEETTVLRALWGGADDYLVKPFRVMELLARMEVVRRRLPRPGTPTAGADFVVVGDVRIEFSTRTVTVGEHRVRLTSREFDVLALLARSPGVVRSRAEILDAVWGDAFLAASRSLDVHIRGIRAKTGRPELIRTLRGAGYRLDSGETAAP
ncbi:response regulator transcription factor [Nocardia macrotermitis]|uniref:KDP operon transcriptional regulatory protein KdpE n=1 Tax=Nocardia macrotermitis TaxID=2585198 RepID=A0A7K0D4N7_9NOCA|nr:response regulator transcription factor [Nocardia macrotermitis]MQY20713.1 KDP operon transcriptional regulatory protein KdpE [Nocardia macrotermitis]